MQKRLLLLNNVLNTLICNILNAEWNCEINSFMVNGVPIERDGYKIIELPNEVELDEDSIDRVFLFSGGAIEFHYKNEQDAFNWGEFSEEVNEKVIEQLKLVWHECCNK